MLPWQRDRDSEGCMPQRFCRNPIAAQVTSGSDEAAEIRPRRHQRTRHQRAAPRPTPRRRLLRGWPGHWGSRLAGRWLVVGADLGSCSPAFPRGHMDELDLGRVAAISSPRCAINGALDRTAQRLRFRKRTSAAPLGCDDRYATQRIVQIDPLCCRDGRIGLPTDGLASRGYEGRGHDCFRSQGRLEHAIALATFRYAGSVGFNS
jgi:hypothetical protein